MRRPALVVFAVQSVVLPVAGAAQRGADAGVGLLGPALAGAVAAFVLLRGLRGRVPGGLRLGAVAAPAALAHAGVYAGAWGLWGAPSGAGPGTLAAGALAVGGLGALLGAVGAACAFSAADAGAVAPSEALPPSR